MDGSALDNADPDGDPHGGPETSAASGVTDLGQLDMPKSLTNYACRSQTG